MGQKPDGETHRPRANIRRHHDWNCPTLKARKEVDPYTSAGSLLPELAAIKLGVEGIPPAGVDVLPRLTSTSARLCSITETPNVFNVIFLVLKMTKQANTNRPAFRALSKAFFEFPFGVHIPTILSELGSITTGVDELPMITIRTIDWLASTCQSPSNIMDGYSVSPKDLGDPECPRHNLLCPQSDCATGYKPGGIQDFERAPLTAKISCICAFDRTP
ncbi:hypothetical protein HGRIS_014677 [Hohenbuehelia grisea]|uniref:Uncharacterized protein n=1 Tax=Hohenbuehelia grisea TaxID=104357 RepID=A0ABR3JU92_9AGAR